jgi:hypothetical protein
MVGVYDPVGVAALVVTDMVELLAVVLLGLKVAAAPPGNPLTLSVTEPAKPPLRAMLTV